MANHEQGVTELIGVYHADGGLLGELSYLIGKALRIRHCALCDITHSPLRRKAAWDQMVGQLGVPFTLLHRNELPADVADSARSCGTPAVLGRCADGDLMVLLGPDDLERPGGSVDQFHELLRGALRRPPLPCAAA